MLTLYKRIREPKILDLHTYCAPTSKYNLQVQRQTWKKDAVKINIKYNENKNKKYICIYGKMYVGGIIFAVTIVDHKSTDYWPQHVPREINKMRIICSSK